MLLIQIKQSKNAAHNTHIRVSKYMKFSTEHDATFRGSYYRPRKPKKHHPDRFHPILDLRRAIY